MNDEQLVFDNNSRSDYLLPLAIVALLVFELSFELSMSSRARFSLRFVDTPEPGDIAALRTVDKIQSLPACVLPEPPRFGTAFVATVSQGNLKIALPPDWHRASIDNVDARQRYPGATFRNGHGSTIHMSRVATSSARRSFMADTSENPLPAIDCESVRGNAGSLWYLYSVDTFGRPDHSAFGDAVTPFGERYNFQVYAPSAEARDSLASLIAIAVTGGH